MTIIGCAPRLTKCVRRRRAGHASDPCPRRRAELSPIDSSGLSGESRTGQDRRDALDGRRDKRDGQDGKFLTLLPLLLSHPSCLIDLQDRKSTRLNSSHRTISYAVFCLKKKKQTT